MPPPSQNAVRTWRPPVHWLPVEILFIIFLLVVDDDDDDSDYYDERVRLMLVCRFWRDTMLKTPGIPSLLLIENSTMGFFQGAIRGTGWRLNVTIDIHDESAGQDFNADAFDGCFTAAIAAASRWRDLVIYSLPRPGQCRAFQNVPPLENLKFFCLDQGCDLGSFCEPLMTAITTTTTPRLMNINISDLNSVLYLVQPGRLHIFRSLTTLSIELSKRMESPANILPHLQRLERFYSRHVYLPIYPPDAPLPLIRTLRDLRLKSVSVQWMAGKVFPVLQSCDITFPHHIDTIRLQPATMPACTTLKYNSNDLDPLRYFSLLPLADLTVASGQWNIMRGNLQLLAICYMTVPRAQSLTRLDLQVRCSEQLLTYGLSLLPALKGLCLRLATPRALSEIFFQAFVATNSNADSPCEKMGGLPSLTLCLKLVELKVIYTRWLRGPERMTPLVFGNIASSRRFEEDFRLCLRLDDLVQAWYVSGHIVSINEVARDGLSAIGISSPRGIISLRIFDDEPLMEVPFKEAEYLVAVHQLSIECLSTLRHLVELRVGAKDILPFEPPPNLPLFHTLRIFEALKINPSFLAGQTFHKLERCRMFYDGEDPTLSEDQVTQMPVCTRLDVNDLTLLATLRLPRVREMCVPLDPEFDMIWEKHVAVNANLLGLELLHVYGWYQQSYLIRALRCLPVLKNLILSDGSNLDAAFFGKFLAIHPDENAEQSHGAGHMSPILCPMLRSLLIEGWDPTEQVDLIPVLKQVVTLRAVCCSPLKRFTLSAIKFRTKFELIGSQGGLVTEVDVLDEDAESFLLNI